jgi:CHASE3 domain sensor protein
MMNIFNNLKVGTKIISGFAIILILMIGMGVTLSFSLNDLKEGFIFLVEHEQPILPNAYQLAKLVVDMETGERGFLITGKEEFLEPFHAGIKAFNALLAVEKKLVSDNPPQVALLEKIGQLHDEWIKQASEPEIAKRREVNKATVSAEQLQDILKAGIGKNILDKIREVLAQLESNLRAKNDLEGVILTIKIAKNMVDQETGERGFIITGADNFLEPYHAGYKQLAINLAALHSRLTDANDLALLEQVKTLSKQWIEQAAKPEIAARREMNTNSVTMNDITAMIQAGTGKSILDKIRIQFDHFIQTEKRLLSIERSNDVRQNVMFINTLTLWLSIASIVFCFLLGLSISRNITRPLQKLTVMSNNFAVGDMQQMADRQNRDELSKITTRRDEMGDIGRSYDTLANSFKAIIEDIVQVLQGLSQGNLQVTPKAEYKGDFVKIKESMETALFILNQVIQDIVQMSQGLAEGGKNVVAKAEYQGDFSQIKNALESAATKLADATAQNAIQDWLKTGQTQLSEQLRGEQDVLTLANNIITFLSTYLKAQVGVFYLLENTGKEARLKLLASYAYTQRKGVANEFHIGEGLIGQAALEKERIIVTEIPEDYISIQSGLGEAVPKQLLVIPFLYENAVKGVIEMGSFHEITEVQLELLDQVMPNIGIAVNTTESRASMQELLKK